jgi:hypothetical protein
MFLPGGFPRGSFAANDGLPLPLVHDPAAWRVGGKGTLTRTALRVYEALLYSTGSDFYPHGRFALELRYLRELSAQAIVSASEDEILRLASPSPEAFSKWMHALSSLIPDVKQGDRILGIFDSEVGVSFYFNDVFCGEVHSPAFARAYASIWLDERTKSPGLRAALLACG